MFFAAGLVPVSDKYQLQEKIQRRMPASLPATAALYLN